MKRDAVADAGQHILERPARGRVVEDLDGRGHRHLMLTRQFA
jgi:hypothetical protein